MGSWNGTCAISNLHITSGKRVVVFMLAENKDKKSFCDNTALYDFCPIPFYGKYDDYGGVDECEGFGLPIVLEAIKSQLYKFGQGANQYHDIAVDKENFDIEKLFEADSEDRLGIEYHNSWNADAFAHGDLEEERGKRSLTDSEMFELDRLANKIKKNDAFRAITHVKIHGDIFDSIMSGWRSYDDISFKDVTDSIPEYIARVKAHDEAWLESVRNGKYISSEVFTFNDPNLAGRYMRILTEYNAILRAAPSAREYVDSGDWAGLEAFTKEALIGIWINMFMRSTRKVWTKQCGEGSQQQEHLGYIVLADAVQNALKIERAYYGEDEE